ncbi:hypothetical protein [Defluviimonas sp. SAOS-178_SWC]|uniref:hypothetical protein n=1 Tax=Defluviimonas sp. SAOS-178_SWC TaxID=3121287 RepID=UPI003221507B
MLGEVTRMALASETFDVILTTRDPTKTDAAHVKGWVAHIQKGIHLVNPVW